MEEVADLLEISPRAVYKALFKALSERQDMELDLPEQLCEQEECQLTSKPKRRGQWFHSRECQYAHHNCQKAETKRSVCEVFNREDSCNHS